MQTDRMKAKNTGNPGKSLDEEDGFIIWLIAIAINLIPLAVSVR